MTTPAAVGRSPGLRDQRQSDTHRLLREAHDATTDVEWRQLLDEVVLLNVKVAHAIAARFGRSRVRQTEMVMVRSSLSVKDLEPVVLPAVGGASWNQAA